jgi:hypothetical protein
MNFAGANERPVQRGWVYDLLTTAILAKFCVVKIGWNCKSGEMIELPSVNAVIQKGGRRHYSIQNHVCCQSEFQPIKRGAHNG